jgi:hypothetical protein
VTLMVRDDFAMRQFRDNRAQLRLRFPVEPTGAEDTQIDVVHVASTNHAVRKPYLAVTYEHP